VLARKGKKFIKSIGEEEEKLFGNLINGLQQLLDDANWAQIRVSSSSSFCFWACLPGWKRRRRRRRRR